jgi:hypothetical protein
VEVAEEVIAAVEGVRLANPCLMVLWPTPKRSASCFRVNPSQRRRAAFVQSDSSSVMQCARISHHWTVGQRV